MNYATLQINCSYRRSALKVMPRMLLCWPVMSETDAGGVVAEFERSHK